MRRPGSNTLVRALFTLALLGLFGLGFAPRAAMAHGCHAPERPTLALTVDFHNLVGSTPDTEVLTSPTSVPDQELNRSSCPKDLPGSLSRILAEIGPAILVETIVTTSLSEHSVRHESARLILSYDKAPPERPPRSL